VNLLLDTHVFPWYIVGDGRFSSSFRTAIEDPANPVFLSVASVWECVIKYELGRLPLPASPDAYLPRERERHEVEPLPIDEGTVVHLARLPQLHRDPFDRILLAQCLQHDLRLVTADSLLKQYNLNLFGD